MAQVDEQLYVSGILGGQAIAAVAVHVAEATYTQDASAYKMKIIPTMSCGAGQESLPHCSHNT